MVNTVRFLYRHTSYLDLRWFTVKALASIHVFKEFHSEYLISSRSFIFLLYTNKHASLAKSHSDVPFAISLYASFVTHTQGYTLRLLLYRYTHAGLHASFAISLTYRINLPNR